MSTQNCSTIRIEDICTLSEDKELYNMIVLLVATYNNVIREQAEVIVKTILEEK